VDLLEGARRISARAVNAVMTASYWEVGCRIVESEQGGKKDADDGKTLLERLSDDPSAKFGRGFSLQNLYKHRQSFLTFPEILPTVSGEFIEEKRPTLSGESAPDERLPNIFQTVSEKSAAQKPLENLLFSALAIVHRADTFDGQSTRNPRKPTNPNSECGQDPRKTAAWRIRRQHPLRRTLSSARGKRLSDGVSGSHHIFTQPGVIERINLQREGSKAKPCQVRQIRKTLATYKLI